MTKEFLDLDIAEIKHAINTAGKGSSLVVIDDVFIPEADVLVCEYCGKRVNIKVDLAYGADVEPIDSLTRAEIDDIVSIVVSHQ